MYVRVIRSIFLIPAVVLLFAAPSMGAEEGMWTFDNPPLKQLADKYNFHPTQGWLDHLRLSSVRMNDGGSGSFISSDGLLLTNHHVARGQLVTVPFRAQQLVAVFPPGSAAPAGPLRPGSLADVPLIVTPPGSSGRRLLEAALGLEGLRPLVAIETSQREAILPLVLAGAGAAVMPEAMAALAAARGAVPVPFDPPPMRGLVVVDRPGSPILAAAAFLAVAARLATRPDV